MELQEDPEIEASSTDASRSSENEPPHQQEKKEQSTHVDANENEEEELDSGETHDSMPELEEVNCTQIAQEILEETQAEEAAKAAQQAKASSNQNVKKSEQKAQSPVTSGGSSPRSNADSDPEGSTDEDMPGLNETPLTTNSENTFRKGDLVELYGLSTNAYNGTRGTIGNFDADKKRYSVQFLKPKKVKGKDHRSASIKSQNLKKVVSEPKAKPAPVKPKKAALKLDPPKVKKVKVVKKEKKKKFEFAAFKENQEEPVVEIKDPSSIKLPEMFKFEKKPEERKPEFPFVEKPKEKEVVKNEPIKPPKYEVKLDALTYETAENKAYYKVYRDLDYLVKIFKAEKLKFPKIKFVPPGNAFHNAMVEKKFPERKMLVVRIEGIAFEAPAAILQKDKVNIKAGRGLIPNIVEDPIVREASESSAPESPSTPTSPTKEKKNKKDKKKKKKEKEKRRKEKERKRKEKEERKREAELKKKEEELKRKEAELRRIQSGELGQQPPYSLMMDVKSLYDKYLIEEEDLDLLNVSQMRYIVWKIATTELQNPKSMWEKFDKLTETAPQPTEKMKKKLTKALKLMCAKNGDIRMSPTKRKRYADHRDKWEQEEELIEKDRREGFELIGTCGFELPQKYGFDLGCEASPSRSVRHTSDHYQYKCVSAIEISGATSKSRVNGLYKAQPYYGFRDSHWRFMKDDGKFSIEYLHDRWTIVAKAGKSYEPMYYSLQNISSIVPPIGDDVWVLHSMSEDAAKKRKKKKNNQNSEEVKSSGTGCDMCYHRKCFDKHILPEALKSLQSSHGASGAKAFKVGDICMCGLVSKKCGGFVYSLTRNFDPKKSAKKVDKKAKDAKKKKKSKKEKQSSKLQNILDEVHIIDNPPDIRLMKPAAMIYVEKHKAKELAILQKKGRKKPEQQAEDLLLRRWCSFAQNHPDKIECQEEAEKNKSFYQSQLELYQKSHPEFEYEQPKEYARYIRKAAFPGLREKKKKPEGDVIKGNKAQIRQYQHKKQEYLAKIAEEKKKEIAEHALVIDMFEEGIYEGGTSLKKVEAATEYMMVASSAGKKNKKAKAKKKKKQKQSLNLFTKLVKRNDIAFVEQATCEVFFADNEPSEDKEKVESDLMALEKKIAASGVKAVLDMDPVWVQIPNMDNLYGILVVFDEMRYAKQYSGILMQDFKIVEYVKLGDFQEMEGYVVEQAPQPNAWAQSPVAMFTDSIARIKSEIDNVTSGVKQADLHIFPDDDGNVNSSSTVLVCVVSKTEFVIKQFPLQNFSQNVQKLNQNLTTPLNHPLHAAQRHEQRRGCIRIDSSKVPKPIDFDNIFYQIIQATQSMGVGTPHFEFCFPNPTHQELSDLSDTCAFFPEIETRRVQIDTDSFTATNFDIFGEHRIIKFPNHGDALQFHQQVDCRSEGANHLTERNQVYRVFFIPDTIGAVFLECGESPAVAPPEPLIIPEMEDAFNMSALQEATDFNLEMSPKILAEQEKLLMQYEGKRDPTPPPPQRPQRPRKRAQPPKDPTPPRQEERKWDEDVQRLRRKYDATVEEDAHDAESSSSMVAHSRSPYHSDASTPRVLPGAGKHPSPLPAPPPIHKQNRVPGPPVIVRDSHKQDFPDETPYEPEDYNRPSSSDREGSNQNKADWHQHYEYHDERTSRRRRREDQPHDKRREPRRKLDDRYSNHSSQQNSDSRQYEDRRRQELPHDNHREPRKKHGDHYSNHSSQQNSDSRHRHEDRRSGRDSHESSQRNVSARDDYSGFDDRGRQFEERHREEPSRHVGESNSHYSQHTDPSHEGFPQTSYHTSDRESRSDYQESNQRSSRQEETINSDDDSSSSHAINIKQLPENDFPEPPKPKYQPPHRRGSSPPTSPMRNANGDENVPDKFSAWRGRGNNMKPRSPPYPKDPEQTDSFPERPNAFPAKERPHVVISEESDSEESSTGPKIHDHRKKRKSPEDVEGYETGWDTPGGPEPPPSKPSSKLYDPYHVSSQRSHSPVAKNSYHSNSYENQHAENGVYSRSDSYQKPISSRPANSDSDSSTPEDYYEQPKIKQERWRGSPRSSSDYQQHNREEESREKPTRNKKSEYREEYNDRVREYSPQKSRPKGSPEPSYRKREYSPQTSRPSDPSYKQREYSPQTSRPKCSPDPSYRRREYSAPQQKQSSGEQYRPQASPSPEPVVQPKKQRGRGRGNRRGGRGINPPRGRGARRGGANAAPQPKPAKTSSPREGRGRGRGRGRGARGGRRARRRGR